MAPWDILKEIISWIFELAEMVDFSLKAVYRKVARRWVRVVSRNVVGTGLREVWGKVVKGIFAEVRYG